MVVCLTGASTTSPRGNAHRLQHRPSRRKVNVGWRGADAIPEERARMWIAVARELDRGAELSGQANHAHRAVRRRRARRTACADFRRALKQSLGQTILVENVTGAGRTIGLARAARAAPDGYTVILGNWTSHVGTPALYPIQQDVLKDFEPVARLPISRLWLTGKTGLPAKDAAELVAWLKANPHKASFGTVGAGSAVHICGIFPAELHRHAVSIRPLPRRRAGLPGPDRGEYRPHVHGRVGRARLPPLRGESRPMRWRGTGAGRRRPRCRR
jgi:hypothetical protein